MNTVKDTCKLDHHELTDTELDAVTGGTTPAPTPKLLEACCKGTHLPEVTIEVW
jgi:bacteriocin-like protein